MFDIDSAFEVEGAISLGGIAGLIAGDSVPDVYNVPDGYLFISPLGVWHRVDSVWVNLMGEPSADFGIVVEANLVTLVDGGLVYETSTHGLATRVGDVVSHFLPTFITSYLSGWDFSDNKNSHWIGSGL